MDVQKDRKLRRSGIFIEQMTKTRLAPLGATFKPEIHPTRLRSRPDVAPSGAQRVLFDPSYKDVAPTEHGIRIAKRGHSGSWVTNRSNPPNKGALRLPISHIRPS